jgi:DNA-binding LytR/AlgR family response regulator
VHRSFLINRSAITLLGRQQLEIGGEKVPVGENYRQNLAGMD